VIVFGALRLTGRSAAGVDQLGSIRTQEPIMTTRTTKSARRTPRRTVRRSAARQHLSDRRYYVQCAYRLAMAIISLVALFTIMGK
jgi:hypothetical protein